MAKINDLRDELVRLNTLYRKGQPEATDAEYDAMVDELRSLAPDDIFFESGVVEQATERMEKLPAPMFSLEKVKTIKEVRKWLLKMWEGTCKNIVITPKYDGISLVVNESSHKAWTRGDGVRGQRSDRHFEFMKNGCRQWNRTSGVTWGEAICPKKKFEEIKEYKNARNMVAGLLL